MLGPLQTGAITAAAAYNSEDDAISRRLVFEAADAHLRSVTRIFCRLDYF